MNGKNPGQNSPVSCLQPKRSANSGAMPANRLAAWGWLLQTSDGCTTGGPVFTELVSGGGVIPEKRGPRAERALLSARLPSQAQATHFADEISLPPERTSVTFRSYGPVFHCVPLSFPLAESIRIIILNVPWPASSNGSKPTASPGGLSSLPLGSNIFNLKFSGLGRLVCTTAVAVRFPFASSVALNSEVVSCKICI